MLPGSEESNRGFAMWLPHPIPSTVAPLPTLLQNYGRSPSSVLCLEVCCGSARSCSAVTPPPLTGDQTCIPTCHTLGTPLTLKDLDLCHLFLKAQICLSSWAPEAYNFTGKLFIFTILPQQPLVIYFSTFQSPSCRWQMNITNWYFSFDWSPNLFLLPHTGHNLNFDHWTMSKSDVLFLRAVASSSFMDGYWS